jgi:hypothetical protein
MKSSPVERTREPASPARSAESENDNLGRIMKEPAFDLTPEFQHFKEVMRGVLAVPKTRLDALVEQAKQDSPRAGNPNAPGKKRRRGRIRNTSK